MFMTKRSMTKVLEKTFAGEVAQTAIEKYEKEQWSKNWTAQMERDVVSDAEVKLLTIEDVEPGDRVLANDGYVTGGCWIKWIVWDKTAQADGTYWLGYGNPGDTIVQRSEVDPNMTSYVGPRGTGGGSRVKPGTLLLIAKGS